MHTRNRRPPMYKPLISNCDSGWMFVPRWYVCRYRVFTKEIRHLETLDADDVKVYLPIVKPSADTKRQLSKSNRPVLPGFVFVRCALARLEKDYRFVHCPVLRTRGVPSRPVYISDVRMCDFQKVAAILAENPPLVYAEEFDFKSLNIVEFRDILGDARFAFLETSQGSKGGTLLVPIQQDELERAFYAHADLDALELPPHALCYKVAAEGDGFAIRHIVRSSKYDLEFVGTALKRSTQALRRLSAGEDLRKRDAAMFQMYLNRYRQAATSSPKFQARIALLLFVCSTVLQHEDESRHFQSKIEGEIMEAYELYVEGVRKDNRPTARKAYEKFVQSYDEATALAEKMKRLTDSFGE